MLDRSAFINTVADLLNREQDPRAREKRVREANRVLYRQVVSKTATDTQADLALAEAAQKEHRA